MDMNPQKNIAIYSDAIGNLLNIHSNLNEDHQSDETTSSTFHTWSFIAQVGSAAWTHREWLLAESSFDESLDNASLGWNHR